MCPGNRIWRTGRHAVKKADWINNRLWRWGSFFFFKYKHMCRKYLDKYLYQTLSNISGGEIKGWFHFPSYMFLCCSNRISVTFVVRRTIRKLKYVLKERTGDVLWFTSFLNFLQFLVQPPGTYFISSHMVEFLHPKKEKKGVGRKKYHTPEPTTAGHHRPFRTATRATCGTKDSSQSPATRQRALALRNQPRHLWQGAMGAVLIGSSLLFRTTYLMRQVPKSHISVSWMGKGSSSSMRMKLHWGTASLIHCWVPSTQNSEWLMGESPEVLLVDVGMKPPRLREVERLAQGGPARKQVVDSQLSGSKPTSLAMGLYCLVVHKGARSCFRTKLCLFLSSRGHCHSLELLARAELCPAWASHPEGISVGACSKQAFHGDLRRRTWACQMSWSPPTPPAHLPPKPPLSTTVKSI